MREKLRWLVCKLTQLVLPNGSFSMVNWPSLCCEMTHFVALRPKIHINEDMENGE
jgi:hypothetical protein